MNSLLSRTTVLALAIVALGFGLRLYRLDAQSFWYDEAYSAGVARATPTDISANRFTDVHPPLYYLVLHLWQRMDDGDFTLRLLSAMLGTAGIAGAYALGKAMFDERVGLVAATITCLAPYTIFYAQEARMYSMVLLLSSVLVLSYYRMLQTHSPLWWLSYTVSAVLSAYVQYFSFLLLLGLHAHFLIDQRRERRSWAYMAACDVLVFLAIARQLAILLSQAQRIAGPQWAAPETPGLARLVSAPYALTLSQFVDAPVVPLAFAVLLLLFIVTHLQLARGLLRRGGHTAQLTLLFCAFWTPLVAAFCVSQVWPLYRERALIVCVPALYLLLGWGVTKTRERNFNLVALVLLGAFALSGLHNWYFDPDFSKPPFRAAAQYLSHRIDVHEPVLHSSDVGFLLFLRYAPEQHHYLIAGDPNPHLPMETYLLLGGEVVEKEEATSRGFWLVVALDQSIDFQRGLVDWFDAHHTLRESYTLDGIYLRHYDGRQDGQQ